MIQVVSAGFKFGCPHANYVFDVSFLPNPWRDSELRGKPLNDGKVRSKVLNAVGLRICRLVADFIELIERNWSDQKIVVAIMCSAGDYRSPIVAQEVARLLEEKGVPCEVSHRDVCRTL